LPEMATLTIELCPENADQDSYADAATTDGGDVSPRKMPRTAEALDFEICPGMACSEAEFTPARKMIAELDRIQDGQQCREARHKREGPAYSPSLQSAAWGSTPRSLSFTPPHVPVSEQRGHWDSEVLMHGVLPGMPQICLERLLVEKPPAEKRFQAVREAEAPGFCAQISTFREEGLNCVFEVEVSGADLLSRHVAKCSLTQLRRVHEEVKSVFAASTGQPLQLPALHPVLVPLPLRRRWWSSKSVELQRWLDQVLSNRLIACSPPLLRFLKLKQPPRLRAAQDSNPFVDVMEHQLPFLENIISFLEAPVDLLNVCTSSYCVCEQDHYWESLFKMTWPAFHESLSFQGDQHWRSLHHQMLNGKIVCILEVFDREKSPGFTMSCVPAWVHWETKSDSYVANYVSFDPDVRPESIPRWEGHRLRFCPAAVRDRLQPLEACIPSRKPSSCFRSDRIVERQLGYPFEPLPGVDKFEIGGGVELQWKKQEGGAFGWWHGLLEKVELDSHGRSAVATLVFPHFPANSAFYRLCVRFGDGRMRSCDFGGISGGLRPISEAEEEHWIRFFRPMETLCC